MSRDLCFTPATELARLYRSRKLSPLEVMRAVLERLDRVNPLVNAVVTLARETYLDALWAAIFVGGMADHGSLPEVARAARGAPPAPQPAHAADLLLDGLALLHTDGYAAATPTLRRALRLAISDGLTGWPVAPVTKSGSS